MKIKFSYCVHSRGWYFINENHSAYIMYAEWCGVKRCLMDSVKYDDYNFRKRFLERMIKRYEN